MYLIQLAIEATTVGAVNVGAYVLLKQATPDYKLAVDLFIMGAAIHLGFEAMGANKWYLKHGAATLP